MIFFGRNIYIELYQEMTLLVLDHYSGIDVFLILIYCYMF